MAKHYTERQRSAFVAVAVKVRDAGGRWDDALIAAQNLGYKGDKSYLKIMIQRAPMSARRREGMPEGIPTDTIQKWRADYRLLRKAWSRYGRK